MSDGETTKKPTKEQARALNREITELTGWRVYTTESSGDVYAQKKALIIHFGSVERSSGEESVVTAYAWKQITQNFAESIDALAAEIVSEGWSFGYDTHSQHGWVDMPLDPFSVFRHVGELDASPAYSIAVAFKKALIDKREGRNMYTPLAESDLL